MIQIVLERVGDQHGDLAILVKQQHRAQVADALVGEARRHDQLHHFHLAKMRRKTEHVNVEQLGDVATAKNGIFISI